MNKEYANYEKNISEKIVVQTSVDDFGVETNEIIWKAETASKNGTDINHSEWVSFSFGEPSVTVLPDMTLLVAFWCDQPSKSGIRYIRLVGQ
jgi:hypothetical protein